MELTWKTSQPIKAGIGNASFDVTAGQTLKIETSPEGDDILEAECPAGKVWNVHVSIFVEESDA